MKHMIITGGTRGIGFGLVCEFLRSGFRVTFTGTSDTTVNHAVDELSLTFNTENFRGVVCDVRETSDLVTLWEFSTSIFGQVDIWFNNAGVSNRNTSFTNLESDEFVRVVDVNIKGLMVATHLAYNKMTSQGHGAIYNMGGLGSDGRMIKGLIPYGMSKRAVQYFTRGFAREIKGGDIICGLVLPGMVLTDLLLDPIRKDPAGTKRSARIFRFLAEEVETVASFIVPRVIENKTNGVVISYLTTRKIIGNFFTRIFRDTDIVSKHL